MTAPPTAVVLRALGLGDVMAGLPALRLLRDVMPHHRVVVLTPAVFAKILRATGLVDDVVPTPRLGPLIGAPTAPAVAIDLHGNGPASRRPLLDLHPGRLVAFGHDGVRWDVAEHEYHRWCRLIRAGSGSTWPDPPLVGLLPRFVSPLSHGLTVLHPGAAFAARRWPVDRFATLGRTLAADGHRVVVTGTPSERAVVGSVAAAIPRATPLVDLTVVQLCGLVAHARLVVSNDTGVAHVASAYGTPSVVLFGPVSPQRWGPPSIPRHQALHPTWRGDAHGDPHGSTLDPVLARITVDDVRDAVGRAEAAVAMALR